MCEPVVRKYGMVCYLFIHDISFRYITFKCRKPKDEKKTPAFQEGRV